MSDPPSSKREIELQVITPEGVELGALYRLPDQRPLFVATIPDDSPAERARLLADVMRQAYPDLFTLILRADYGFKAYEVSPQDEHPLQARVASLEAALLAVAQGARDPMHLPECTADKPCLGCRAHTTMATWSRRAQTLDEAMRALDEAVMGTHPGRGRREVHRGSPVEYKFWAEDQTKDSEYYFGIGRKRIGSFNTKNEASLIKLLEKASDILLSEDEATIQSS